jgi:hypothetical protein
MKFKCCVLALLLAVPAAAFAAEPEVDVVAKPFAAQRAAIEAGLSDGKTYAEISPADRRTVTTALERMTSLLAGAQDPASLDDDTRIALFNEQEVVNTILTRAREDSRVVCRKRAPIGTRFAKGSCETVAEARRAREASQDELRRTPDVPRVVGP